VTYRIHYGVLRTGGEISELPVASCSFGDELRSTGSFQAQVAVGQCGNGSLWQSTRGAYTFWAAEWFDDGGRRLVAGGPLFARTGDDNGITYGGSNLFAMMGHRKLINQAWTDAQISANALTFSSLDLGSIISAIVQQVTAAPPADLPIAFEAPRSGINTRTYNGYDLAWAADKIAEIGNVESGTGGLGGPDWLFTPRFVAGDFTHIEWVLTTGTAAQPWLTQTGATVVLDRGPVGQQNVGPITVSEDAAKLSTTAFAANSGAEKTKLIASATDTTLTDAGYPRMDGDAPINNNNDASMVAAYAQGELTRTKRTPDGVTVAVLASWWWAQGGGTGTTVHLIDPKNPVFGPIDLTSRVIKWDVQDIGSEWVTLTLADSLGGV
jgi:hypothetical protein